MSEKENISNKTHIIKALHGNKDPSTSPWS